MSARFRRSACRGLPFVVLLAAIHGTTAPLLAQSTQLESCRRSVVERFATSAPTVGVAMASQDGRGNATIRWSATYRAGSSNGTCVVDRLGRTLRVDVGSSSGAEGPQIQPPVTPGFGATRVTCESVEARRKECAIPANHQVRLVRTLSVNPCTEGRTWGKADRIIWVASGCRGEFEVSRPPTTVDPGFGAGSVRRITCGSASGKQMECKTGGYATQVRLVRNLSAARCIEKSNWGYTGTFIWANKGCRGEFEVTYRGTTPRPPTPPTPATRTITCGNSAGADMSCNPMGTVSSIRLVRDLSGRCRQNSTWGFTQSDLWVRQGCHGQFEVSYMPVPQPQPR